MNLQLPPDPGPYGADTDDAVSAYIDGELAGFATDHGLDVESVRVTLEAWGGFEARRTRLASTQRALRTAITLDDPTRAALVAAAMAAEPDAAPVIPIDTGRSRRTVIMVRITTAAAVVLLAAGAVVVVQQNSDTPRARVTASTGQPAGATPTSSRDSSDPGGVAPASATTTNPTTPAPAPAPTALAPSVLATAAGLGEVSDPKVLLAAARAALASGPQNPLAPSVCPALDLFPAGTTVVMRTPATFNGDPVNVEIGAQGTKTLVFVVAPSSCSIRSAVAF